MLDRPRSAAPLRFRLAPRLVIAAHLAVVLGAGLMLARSPSPWAWGFGALASGTSLFALTGLARAASPDDRRPAGRHRRWWGDALGMVAGWPCGTPMAADRAFRAAHHAATNGDGDPNRPLNSRWMLLVGAPVAVALVHRHALRTLRGRALGRYLLETGLMVAAIGLVLVGLPPEVRGRAFFLPLAVAALWQNLRIVSEHLDLPAGRFHDTWQLALPAPISRWLLHADHHLEHHLRPDLRWHELPVYRAEIARGGFIAPDQQVTALGFVREVLCKRRVDSGPSPAAGAPRWAGRAAIRARPRQPNHPTRGSVA